jgi:TetR/AcrR family transcriptional regulator, repressor for uid operon
MSTAALTTLRRAIADAPADDATSTRILDAALELAAASGLRHLTMDDVARRARVGRMTVYRRFHDRQGLVDALNAREMRRCLAELDAAADPSQPIDDQVAAGFVTSIRLATEHPLLARLAHGEPDAVLGSLNAGVFAAATEFLAGRLRQAQAAGVLGDVDVDTSAELLVRLALSFVLVPGSKLPLDDPERLAATARAQVAPMLAG